MSLIQKIPLQADTTDQQLSIEIDGNPYVLRVLWNERFGYFSLSIFTADEEAILTNIKMVKNHPLTKRFKDSRLPFGSFYFVQEKGSAARPGYGDLGVNFGLYYYEPDEEVAAEIVRQEVTPTPLGTIWDSGLSVWDSGSSVWDV